MFPSVFSVSIFSLLLAKWEKIQRRSENEPDPPMRMHHDRHKFLKELRADAEIGSPTITIVNKNKSQ